MNIKIDTTRKIFDLGLKVDAPYYEVGPDREDSGCVEIRHVEGPRYCDRISVLAVSPDYAMAMAKAMIDCAKEMKGTSNE